MYLLHPDLGGDLLGMAGSDPLTEAWTREHPAIPIADEDYVSDNGAELSNPPA